MVQELELSDDYANIHELRGRNRGGAEQSGASSTKSTLLRVGILTLAVLCILQATLNISLRLAFYSKEDADQFPFISNVIPDVCRIEQFQQNSTQSCSCCKNLLRTLMREYQALEKERDALRDIVRARQDPRDQETGSGALEDFIPAETIMYH